MPVFSAEHLKNCCDFCAHILYICVCVSVCVWGQDQLLEF